LENRRLDLDGAGGRARQLSCPQRAWYGSGYTRGARIAEVRFGSKAVVWPMSALRQ